MKLKNKSSDRTRNDRLRNDALNKSKKEREEKLPGDYPAKEDIMNRNNMERVGMDVENFSRKVGIENSNKPNEPVTTNPDEIQEEPVTGNDPEQPGAREMEHPVPKDLKLDEENATGESDVTDEDLEALGPRDLSLDMGEDEKILKNRVWPVDMAGEDLDVPGAELDDSREAIGSEDEENNPYSLGGDTHEDDLEGK